MGEVDVLNEVRGAVSGRLRNGLLASIAVTVLLLPSAHAQTLAPPPVALGAAFLGYFQLCPE